VGTPNAQFVWGNQAGVLVCCWSTEWHALCQVQMALACVPLCTFAAWVCYVLHRSSDCPHRVRVCACVWTASRLSRALNYSTANGLCWHVAGWQQWAAVARCCAAVMVTFGTGVGLKLKSFMHLHVAHMHYCCQYSVG
jgi:hypothetical protein